MRVKITLACTECKQRNYNMTKEKKNHPERLETKKKKQKSSKAAGWIQGLQAEFKKIIWPDKPTLVKQTIAVICITAVLGVIIAVLDSGVLQLLNLIIK